MELDFADVKPSILNWVLVGLMALTFIVFAKFIVTKFPNAVTNFFRDPILAA